MASSPGGETTKRLSNSSRGRRRRSRRFNTLAKKCGELSTLCGIDICLIYNQSEGQNEMRYQTWPMDQSEVRRILQRCRVAEMSSRVIRERQNIKFKGPDDDEKNQTIGRKIEQKLADATRQLELLKYWNRMGDHLSCPTPFGGNFVIGPQMSTASLVFSAPSWRSGNSQDIPLLPISEINVLQAAAKQIPSTDCSAKQQFEFDGFRTCSCGRVAKSEEVSGMRYPWTDRLYPCVSLNQKRTSGLPALDHPPHGIVDQLRTGNSFDVQRAYGNAMPYSFQGSAPSSSAMFEDPGAPSATCPCQICCPRGGSDGSRIGEYPPTLLHEVDHREWELDEFDVNPWNESLADLLFSP